MRALNIGFMVSLLGALIALKEGYDRYPELRGQILGDAISYKVAEGEIIRSTQKSGWKYTNKYHIYYAYKVDGDVYYSTMVDFLGRYNQVAKYLEAYPKGKKIPVYYDSSDPGFAVLDYKSKGLFHLLKIPLFLICLSLFCTYQWIQDRKKYSNKKKPYKGTQI